MTTDIYSGRPITVTVEASCEVIRDQHLDTFENEHFDTIRNVISVRKEGKNVVIESCRSIEAWRAGEENGGRGEWEFPTNMLERVWINGVVVYGPAYRGI